MGIFINWIFIVVSSFEIIIFAILYSEHIMFEGDKSSVAEIDIYICINTRARALN